MHVNYDKWHSIHECTHYLIFFSTGQISVNSEKFSFFSACICARARTHACLQMLGDTHIYTQADVKLQAHTQTDVLYCIIVQCHSVTPTRY